MTVVPTQRREFIHVLLAGGALHVVGEKVHRFYQGGRLDLLLTAFDDLADFLLLGS